MRTEHALRGEGCHALLFYFGPLIGFQLNAAFIVADHHVVSVLVYDVSTSLQALHLSSL